MSIKSVFFVAGAVLLIAGCSNGPTSPRSSVSGGAAAAVKAPKTPPAPGTANSQGECRSGYVFSGREGDSVCLDDIQ